MAEPKFHKRIGNNIRQAMKARNAQMRFIIDNMKEPVFSEEKSEDGFDRVGISLRILNHGFGGNSHNGIPSRQTVCTFMMAIQDYLPSELRRGYTLWSRGTYANNPNQKTSEETEEIIQEMLVWLENMAMKIEDKFSHKYITGGRMNVLEILKRRFRNEWSEAKIVDVTADANVKAKVDEDTTINIVFKDRE